MQIALEFGLKAKIKGFVILLQGDNGLFAYEFINVLSYGLDTFTPPALYLPALHYTSQFYSIPQAEKIVK
jgi:hypothetical protein